MVTFNPEQPFTLEQFVILIMWFGPEVSSHRRVSVKTVPAHTHTHTDKEGCFLL